jgi:2-polyprenyl-3-methyl-5-hydroxy-6-metoxy-1,4-benzoquinol methylase
MSDMQKKGNIEVTCGDEIHICPLCDSNNIRLLEELPTIHLIKLYKKLIRRDISGEFQGASRIQIHQCKECALQFSTPTFACSKILYEDLQAFTWYYLDQRPEYDFAIQFLKERDRILDIGCGKGNFAKYLSLQKYVGLEYNEKAIEKARKDGIFVLNQSIEEFSSNNNGKFSVACAFQVLEHIVDLKTFLRASVECLMDNGLFIISVPSSDSFMSVLKNEILNLPPHHVTWWSDDCLKNLSRYFPLKLIHFSHEKLTDSFKQRYLSTIFIESFRSHLKLSSARIDLSLKGKIALRLSAYLAKIFLSGLKDPRLLPDGHSVFAVYKKNPSL